MNETTKPMVSVRLMTYNHGPFIRQAMEGILSQVTDFLVEVVVGDDFSKDDTLDIIKSYSDTDKIKINILQRTVGDQYWITRQEKGRIYNIVDIFANCSGKYIALLDGDDYWTDPLKLQRQVDFMEANPNYSLCFHNARILENGRLLDETKVLSEKWMNDRTSSDLIKGKMVPTLTVLFRGQFVDQLPEGFFNVLNADTFLFAWLGQFGAGKYLKNVEDAIYRKHGGGIWSGSETTEKKLERLNTFQVMKITFQRKHASNIDATINKLIFGIVRDYRSSGQRVKAVKFILAADMPASTKLIALKTVVF